MTIAKYMQFEKQVSKKRVFLAVSVVFIKNTPFISLLGGNFANSLENSTKKYVRRSHVAGLFGMSPSSPLRISMVPARLPGSVLPGAHRI